MGSVTPNNINLVMEIILLDNVADSILMPLLKAEAS